MDALSSTTILSNLIGAAVGVVGLWAFVVRPYQEKLDAAMAELRKIQALNLDQELDRQAQRIAAIEERERHLSNQLPQNYVTQAALLRSEEHRDRKFDLVNAKLDAQLACSSQHTEALAAIKTQINTLFKLWNEEHRRP